MTVTGNDVVNYAEKFLGRCRYVLGGQDPTDECDCSGFIWAVYHHFFPDSASWKIRTNARGYAKYGKKVSFGKLRPGDIVIMHTGWRGTAHSDPDHVGIFCGGDKIIQVGHNSHQNGCYFISKAACRGIILYGRRIISARTAKKAAKTSSKTTKYRVYSEDGLNVRKGPGTKYKVKNTVGNHVAVRVSKFSGSWAYVPKLNGWISKAYIKKA